MKQDPAAPGACGASLLPPPQPEGKSKGLQERQGTWSFWDLSLWGPQLVSFGSQSP